MLQYTKALIRLWMNPTKWSLKQLFQFKEFHESEEMEVYEISESNKRSSEAIRRIIMTEISGDEPWKIKKYNKGKRDALIKKLVLEKNISKSALERATGISRGTIIRITK